MTDTNIPIDPDLGAPDEGTKPVGGGDESTPEPEPASLADPRIGGTLGDEND